MSIPPKKSTPRYTRQLDGVYGEFGSGGTYRAFYIQSAILPRQLEWISLISDIPGSERWSVRDLFQRDVDDKRVTDQLLPYLTNSKQLRFFNPLTLTILPMEDHGNKVLTQMPRMHVRDDDWYRQGEKWKCLERENYYRVRWRIDGDEDGVHFGTIEWNEARSRLVAIDGQHRVSALQRILKDDFPAARQDLVNWHIPAVIVSFRAGSLDVEPPGVLETVRGIFVSINKEAQKVNEAKQILLSDGSVNSVFTQELLERSHSNDLAASEARTPERLPLLFFDWRGEESGGLRVGSPAAIKDVVEIRAWFENYLLGKDFDGVQETALGVNPTHELHDAFHDRLLDSRAQTALRKAREHGANSCAIPSPGEFCAVPQLRIGVASAGRTAFGRLGKRSSTACVSRITIWIKLCAV